MQIENLETKIFQSVACGENHTIAVTRDGDIWGWGNIENYKLSFNVTDIKLKNLQTLKGQAYYLINNCGGPI